MPKPETEGRIRDAAVALFASQGFSHTTVRQVATEAGVSAGLVIHYFGSKDGLRAACDRHVAEVINEHKRASSEQGGSFDPMEAFRRASDGPPLARYLARAIAESSPGGASLLDQLVADARENIGVMVANGMAQPSDDDYGRAVVLTIWSVGALVLHEHVERLLGVDLLTDLRPPENAVRYLRPVLEILGGGVLTPQVVEAFAQAFPTGDPIDDETEQDREE